jgi:hypothetical protein
MLKNKYLICVSPNDNPTAALRYASLKAKNDDSRLEILSIIDTTCTDYQGIFSVGETLKKEKRTEIEEKLKKLSKQIYKWSNITPILNIKEGDIISEITNTLNTDKSIKLFLVTSSEKSSSQGKLISDITEKLYLDKIAIPSLIIPANLSDKQIEELL